MNTGFILSESMRETLPLTALCIFVVVMLAVAMVAGVRALDWYRAVRQEARAPRGHGSQRSRE
ncbi:MAG TPA: hypothetical protein VMF06_12195 [Candidatus Limnocylindria bacterium]|jgi:hypothetical protein|nr:hypothetical protein [Candidatus Limnocylindria bacterium]